ncbi:MAG: sigma-70 family RNA polymerase sigma factor [Pirellulales bacterium]
MGNFDITGLISVSRQGDDDAKAELVGHFRNYLRLLAHIHLQPLLQAKFDESDIVQETCLQAALAFDQFRGTNEQQFAAWLRQIMANKGAGMARKYIDTGKRDVRLEEHLQHDLDQSSIGMENLLPAGDASPSQDALRRERSVVLADAIAQVRDDQREVLIRHGLEGMTVAEVAKSMGRSEASIWKLWARGLRELRNVAKGEEA